MVIYVDIDETIAD